VVSEIVDLFLSGHFRFLDASKIRPWYMCVNN